MTGQKYQTPPSQTVWSPPNARTNRSLRESLTLRHKHSLTTRFVKFAARFLSFFFLFRNRKKRYKAYRDEQAKLHAAWLEREEARLAAVARGDPNPPAAEPDPTDLAAAEREVGLFGLCKFLVYVLLFGALAGKFVTGEWLWGGEGDVRKALLGGLWPIEQRLFSERLLGEFDGSDALKPLFIAVRFFFFFFSAFLFLCG